MAAILLLPSLSVAMFVFPVRCTSSDPLIKFSASSTCHRGEAKGLGRRTTHAAGGESGRTYSVQRVDLGEVLERLQAADVEADHLELRESLQVRFVILRQPLDRSLVENEIIELDRHSQKEDDRVSKLLR